MKEEFFYEEDESFDEASNDFYSEEEIDRELEDGMISPEEEAFTRGYLGALD